MFVRCEIVSSNGVELTFSSSGTHMAALLGKQDAPHIGTKPRHPGDDHSALKQRAAAAPIVASLTLALIKLAAGFASGSLALVSEGAQTPSTSG